MSGLPDPVVLRQFRALFGSGTVAGLSDGQLLERFLSGEGEEAEIAFAALLARHGPMVLGVCRRALRDPSDAEDAFQATFLVLVRKGRTVRVDDSLGRWLYGVSRKVAGRARALAARRARVEGGTIRDLPAPSVADSRELASMLDEEIGRLAEPFRSAVVLCDLGGLSHEEAARDLRCPVGTIKSRVARGRARLRTRLARRGFAPLAALLGAEGAPARATLIESTVGAATRYAASGGKAPAGMVSAAAVSLAEGVVRAMTITKIQTIGAAALVILGLAGTGAVVAQQMDRSVPARSFGRTKVQETKRATTPPATTAEDPRLDARVTVDLKDRPIGEVAAFLVSQTNVSIEIDAGVMKSLGLSRDLPTTLTVKDVPLRTALTAWLQGTGLKWLSDGNGVLVSAPTDPHAQFRAARDTIEGVVAGLENPADPKIKQAQAEIATFFDRLERDLIGPKKPEVEASPLNLGGRPTSSDTPPRESAKVSMPDYVVEPPDIIVVEVLQALQGRPITGERLVRPDGKISLGFYGEVYVAGMTPNMIKQKIIFHLSDFLGDDQLGLVAADPKTGEVRKVNPARSAAVFVDVAAYNSKVYYVLGDVGTPGRLPITGNETVLDAINYAGGLIPTGKEKPRIRLVRPATAASGEKEHTYDVDLIAIQERGETATNYQMLPGDRLVVFRTAPYPVPNAPDPQADALDARFREMERKLELILERLDKPKQP